MSEKFAPITVTVVSFTATLLTEGPYSGTVYGNFMLSTVLPCLIFLLTWKVSTVLAGTGLVRASLILSTASVEPAVTAPTVSPSQHGCVPAVPLPRSAASVSPGRIILAPPRPARPTSGCAIIQAPSALDRLN